MKLLFEERGQITAAPPPAWGRELKHHLLYS